MRALMLLILLALALPAAAQGPTLIRDAEIERTLRRLATPVLQAAGIPPATVDLYIIQDPRMNAFVAGGANIFLSTGLLTRLPEREMVQAVIAHEVGHLTGGHLITRRLNAENARALGAAGLALAIAAAAASRSPEAGAAIASGTSEAARRQFLGHTRAEEAAADQASVRFLAAAGIDPRAQLRVLELFRGQEVLSVDRRSAYVRTHPLTSDRIRSLETRIALMEVSARGPTAEEIYWHARMVAKFEAFLRAPRETFRRADQMENSEFATLSRAIAYHKSADLRRALDAIDRLIAARPGDGFYHELRGQFLLEAGQAGPAVNSYLRASQLEPGEGLILAGLGRALLAMDTDARTREALGVLQRARREDGANPRLLRDLAIAHARLGQTGEAALATAEAYAMSNRLADAATLARRAAGLLPQGTPGWRRAQDIIAAADR